MKLTPSQIRDWKELISRCKSPQSSINVGGKAMREILIAIDDIINAQLQGNVTTQAGISELLKDGWVCDKDGWWWEKGKEGYGRTYAEALKEVIKERKV